MPQPERHVRLFRNGRNQALRIPREFELEGNEAIIRKEGDRLIVEPIRKGRLLALLTILPALDEHFPDRGIFTCTRSERRKLAVRVANTAPVYVRISVYTVSTIFISSSSEVFWTEQVNPKIRPCNGNF